MVIGWFDGYDAIMRPLYADLYAEVHVANDQAEDHEWEDDKRFHGQ
jgi:hypothetical protein